MDREMLTIVNCAGAGKQVGHGNKMPFFIDVSEKAKSLSAFAVVKDVLTYKQCVDRCNKLVSEHRANQPKLVARTGTDDEVVDEIVMLLDDICSALDDAEEDLEEVQERKRKGDRDLVEAGEDIRDRAMRRSRKKKKKANKDASDDKSTSGSEIAIDEPSAAPRPPSPSGGPTSVTPRAAARTRKTQQFDDTSEQALLESANERDGQKIEIDAARLDMERENFQRLAKSEDRRHQFEAEKLAQLGKELELRKQKQEMDIKDREERLKLDRERMECDRADREAERVAKEKAAERQDKLLEAVIALAANRRD